MKIPKIYFYFEYCFYSEVLNPGFLFYWTGYRIATSNIELDVEN